MNRFLKVFSFFFILLIVPKITNAQFCNDFEKNYCTPSDKNSLYQFDGQSRSALFDKGQTSSFKINAYQGLSYRISLCSETDLGTLRMRIISTDTVVTVDSLTNQKTISKKQEVIYDNANNKYATDVTFSMPKNKTLIIEITTGAKMKTKNDDGKTLIGGETGCVGVLIEHRVEQKKGF